MKALEQPRETFEFLLLVNLNPLPQATKLPRPPLILLDPRTDNLPPPHRLLPTRARERDDGDLVGLGRVVADGGAAGDGAHAESYEDGNEGDAAGEDGYLREHGVRKGKGARVGKATYRKRGTDDRRNPRRARNATPFLSGPKVAANAVPDGGLRREACLDVRVLVGDAGEEGGGGDGRGAAREGVEWGMAGRWGEVVGQDKLELVHLFGRGWIAGHPLRSVVDLVVPLLLPLLPLRLEYRLHKRHLRDFSHHTPRA